MVSGYTGANDHKGLARPTNRNRRSCENFLNFFGERWENSFGDHGFGFLFSPRTSRSKLQNVNMILRDALPDATDALSNASVVYYSNRYLCNQHF